MKNYKQKIAFLGLKGMPPKFGGLQFDAEDIGEGLAQRGYEITVFCRKWYQGDFKEKEYKDMKIITFSTFQHFKILDVFIQNLKSFNYIIKNKITIVYLFSASSYFIIPMLKLFKIKTIIRRNGNLLKTISYNWVERLILDKINIFAMKICDIITAETIVEKEHAEKYTNKKVFITPVGINLKEKISPNLIYEKYKLNGNDYIYFIGRFVKVKRIEWLINSFIASQNNHNLKLILSGSSDDTEYVNYITKLSKQSSRIIMTGYVDGILKDELISNCRCMVLPSASEGMSTAVMESLSYGKICLLSDIDVHKWIINNESYGLLFKESSNSDLTHKLNNLILGKYAFDSEKIKNYMSKRFSKEKINDEIDKMIKAI